MGQRENYTSIWALDKDIKELKLKIYVLYFILSFWIVLSISLIFLTEKNESRLDAHKKVIELQQKQINQLIIHCEYERNK